MRSAILRVTAGREPSDLLLRLLRLAVFFYVLFFALGISLREIGGGTATGALALYYLLDFRNSRLARAPWRWAVAAFLGLILFKTVHTIDFSASLSALSHASYKSLLLFLAAFEALRSRRDVLAAAWCAIAAFVLQGADGVWQAATGADFIKGDPILYGRLTGSLSTGRVGNYVSLLAPAALALPAVLPRVWPRALRWGLALAASAPGLYLLYAARARSGWTGFAAALWVLALVRFGWKKSLAALVPLAGTVAALVAAGPGRLSEAPRLDVWATTVGVFKSAPLLGTGVNTFNTAFNRLGLRPEDARFSESLPHPHNVYLQFLAETGVTGLAVWLLFAGWLTLWCFRSQDREALAAGEPEAAVAACFFAAWCGYLVTAVTAHNYFRTWWLGMGMTILGCALAAAWNLRRDRGAAS